MTIQPREDAIQPRQNRCACRTLLALLALLLGACTQLTSPPTAQQTEIETTSPSSSPGQVPLGKAAAAQWAAEKRAAEERAAALWAADKLRAEKRAAEDLAAEKLAVAIEKQAKGEGARSMTAKSAKTEKRKAEFAFLEGASAEKAESEALMDASATAEEAVPPVASKDWSEVKYPWEEVSTSKEDELEQQPVAVKQERAHAAEKSHRQLKGDLPTASDIERSGGEYPREGWGSPKGDERDQEAVAGKPEREPVAEEVHKYPKGDSSAASGIDWSKVKYPWEEEATPAVEQQASDLELRQEPKATEEKEVAVAPVKAMPPPLRRGKRPPPSLKVERLSIGNGTIEMVRVPGGDFMMGSVSGDGDERPVHAVKVPTFLMGRFEVTQRQWASVMGQNPSYFSDCGGCPVDNVSWDDIQLFIEKLNQKTGKHFRLPSEAEWEYACRAGEDNLYCGGSDETLLAWYGASSGGRAQPAGRLEPNAYGIYDMSGNVYEWVGDCWNDGYERAPRDGSTWQSGECQRRVLRGGAWYYSSRYAMATYRNANTPDSRFIIYGFRLAHDTR